MSFHRENVTWQSADGTWSLGFWEVLHTGDDPEWDVEYGNRFEWVTTGHHSEDSACRAWPGANPGGTTVVAYSDENAAEIDKYNDMVWEFRYPEQAAQRSHQRLRDEIRQKIADEKIMTGSYVSVMYGFNENPGMDDKGSGFCVQGMIVRKGEWDMVEDVKIFNSETNEINPRLVSIRRVNRTSRW